jgi:hypothetical protein
VEKQKASGIWLDGICKSCGYPVIERSGLDLDKDYANTCTNQACEHAYWHSCFDDEFLDYYDHGREAFLKRDHADARRLRAARAALQHCDIGDGCPICRIPKTLCLAASGFKLYDDAALDRLADALGIE